MIETAERFDVIEKKFKPAARKYKHAKKITPGAIKHGEVLTSDMISYAYRQGIHHEEAHFSKEVQPHSSNGTNPHMQADEALAAAIYCVARSADNPQEAFMAAVNASHESGAIASLVGAFLGAMYSYPILSPLPTIFSTQELELRIMIKKIALRRTQTLFAHFAAL
jgi:ADP-ribosylglycohydrolase